MGTTGAAREGHTRAAGAGPVAQHVAGCASDELVELLSGRRAEDMEDLVEGGHKRERRVDGQGRENEVVVGVLVRGSLDGTSSPSQRSPVSTSIDWK